MTKDNGECSLGIFSGKRVRVCPSALATVHLLLGARRGSNGNGLTCMAHAGVVDLNSDLVRPWWQHFDVLE
jgi:hypothetical protein